MWRIVCEYRTCSGAGMGAFDCNNLDTTRGGAGEGGAREAQNDLIDIKRHLYGDRRTNEDNSRAFIE